MSPKRFVTVTEVPAINPNEKLDEWNTTNDILVMEFNTSRGSFSLSVDELMTEAETLSSSAHELVAAPFSEVVMYAQELKSKTDDEILSLKPEEVMNYDTTCNSLIIAISEAINRIKSVYDIAEESMFSDLYEARDQLKNLISKLDMTSFQASSMLTKSTEYSAFLGTKPKTD